MLKILERMGNVLFWCGVLTGAFFIVISIGYGLENSDDFGEPFGAGLAIYAAGVAARYILSGNPKWMPWRKDTYR